MDPNELLARFSEQQVAAFFLVLCRITPLFFLAPLFSSKMIPRAGPHDRRARAWRSA